MSTELTTMSAKPAAMNFTDDQVQLIKDQICKGSSDDELKMFMYQAQRTGLDPIARQIYAMKRWDSKLSREVMTTGVSIDGFRLIAQRSGDYAGQVGPYWCGDDGVWIDVWLSNKPPRAAKVGLLRTNFKEPLYAIALYDEYVQKYLDKKENQWKVSPMWAKMPSLMLAKVAESLAIRKAFPQELSGLYSAEELNVDTQDFTQPKQVSQGSSFVSSNPETNPGFNPGAVGGTVTDKRSHSDTVVDNRPPTEKMIKRLFAIGYGNGHSQQQIRDVLVSVAGVDSTSELTKTTYDLVCEHLQNTAPNSQLKSLDDSDEAFL